MRTNNNGLFSGRQSGLTFLTLTLGLAGSLSLTSAAFAGQEHRPATPAHPTQSSVQTGILEQTGVLQQNGSMTQTGIFRPNVNTTGGSAPTTGGSAPTTGGSAPTTGGSAPTTGGNINGSPITGTSSINQSNWWFNPAYAQASQVSPGALVFQGVVNKVDCTTGAHSFTVSLYFAAASWNDTDTEPGKTCAEWVTFAMKNDQLAAATGLIGTLPDAYRIPYTVGVVDNLLRKLEIQVPKNLPAFPTGLVGVEVGPSH